MDEIIQSKIARIEERLDHNTELTKEVHAAVVGKSGGGGISSRTKVLEVQMKAVLGIISIAIITAIRAAWKNFGG